MTKVESESVLGGTISRLDLTDPKEPRDCCSHGTPIKPETVG